MTLDDESLLKLATEDGIGFINSLPQYVVIDEVQRAPNLMLAIKKSVDENRLPGRFLLTGSANLQLMEQIQDSLADRHEPVYLSPLTSHEVASLPVEQSFTHALLNNQLHTRANAYLDSINQLKNAVIRGGYPVPLKRSESRAKKWNGGVLFYNGDHILPKPIKNTLALPYGIFWDVYQRFVGSTRFESSVVRPDGYLHVWDPHEKSG